MQKETVPGDFGEAKRIQEEQMVMNNSENKMPLRTAAYCRVSTEKEKQDSSYEIQERYYKNLIQSDPNMEFVGIYGDRGKSGLYANSRRGLQSLMEDCRAGKIDQILTKSISRFARNMAECAAMIRELRALGVNVIFEKENINTSDDRCELILSILSAIAQEESGSIRQNILRSHEQHVLEGRPYGSISFGYYNAGNNCWAINEEEAPKIRMAFEMAARGECYREIRNALNETETEYKWNQKRLRYMLTNPVYKGDYYSNKTVCLVPGKQVKNMGYRDRYYISGHHEPIVSPELFDRVQKNVESGLLITYKHKKGNDVCQK